MFCPTTYSTRWYDSTGILEGFREYTRLVKALLVPISQFKWSRKDHGKLCSYSNRKRACCSSWNVGNRQTYSHLCPTTAASTFYGRTRSDKVRCKSHLDVEQAKSRFIASPLVYFDGIDMIWKHKRSKFILCMFWFQWQSILGGSKFTLI